MQIVSMTAEHVSRLAELEKLITPKTKMMVICSPNNPIGGVLTRENLEGVAKIMENKDGGRDMLIRVTDKRLLSATGGIVQGMSGSPILQNGKLVGAVTHVLVSDPTKGYAILMEHMLEAEP